jgi:hypothetical protein
LASGYSVQARENGKDNEEKEFYLRQKEAYSSYAAQVTADPSIVLRERWYAETTEAHRSADISARQMVFDHSFRPDNLSVPYTKDQLREISELAQNKRLYVVCHPKCPPDLIELMWTSVFASRQAWIIGHMIEESCHTKASA